MMTSDDILLIANAFKLALQTQEQSKRPDTRACGIGWAGGFVAGAIEESNPDFSTEWFVDYAFGTAEKG